MGVGGEKKAMHEIPETYAAGKDEAFEEIIKKIIQAGGKIIEDDTHPLYTDVGSEEFCIGNERTVEFNINRMDFKLIRKVENYILQGSGHKKHIEELQIPRAKITLRKKSEMSDDWQTVDIDEIF